MLKYISFITLNSVLPTEVKKKKKDCFFPYKADSSSTFSPSGRNEFILRHPYVLVQSTFLTNILIFQLAQIKGLVYSMPMEQNMTHKVSSS